MEKILLKSLYDNDVSLQRRIRRLEEKMREILPSKSRSEKIIRVKTLERLVIAIVNRCSSDTGINILTVTDHELGVLRDFVSRVQNENHG
jgi:hypothetical protein